MPNGQARLPAALALDGGERDREVEVLELEAAELAGAHTGVQEGPEDRGVRRCLKVLPFTCCEQPE